MTLWKSLLFLRKFFRAMQRFSPSLKVLTSQTWNDTNGPEEQNEKLPTPRPPAWCPVQSPQCGRDTSQLLKRDDGAITSQLCCVRLASGHSSEALGHCVSSWHLPQVTFYSPPPINYLYLLALCCKDILIAHLSGTHHGELRSCWRTGFSTGRNKIF